MTPTEALAPIVDTHAHLDEPVFDRDRDDVLAAARAAGVIRIINIAYSPERWQSSALLREHYAEVDIAVGLHPQLASNVSDDLERALESAVTELRPVAIGETGFDLARGSSSVEAQRRAFHFQLSLATATNLPVIIHQRDAGAEVLAELDRWPKLASIVLHSFDGTPRLTDWAVERGCFIGIGGLATRPANAGLRELLQLVPAEVLLLETDAPYLSPPGTPRRNTPSALPLIAERLAPLWGLTKQELCILTAGNATRVFGVGV